MTVLSPRKFKRIFIVLALWSFTIGFGGYYLVLKNRQNTTKTVKALEKKAVEIQTENIVFYLPNGSESGLEKITEIIPVSGSNREKINRVVEKNLELLVEKRFLSDRRIELLNAYFDQRTLYLDFNLSMGQLDEENQKNSLIIQSLTNSLTEILGIERVKYIVNGSEGKQLLSKYHSHS